MSLSPETLAEQVMGYVVGASELIPTLKPSKNIQHSIAILPQGPHFYTGLLQAAGYLLLDNQKKKIMIISQQSGDPKNIVIDENTYGPILGETWNMKHTTKIADNIGAILSHPGQKQIMDQTNSQLPFLKVITKTEILLHISIGDKISSIKRNRLLTWINNNIQEYNIILLTNIDISPSIKFKKTDEQKHLSMMIKTSSTNPILTIFQKISTIHKKKPEIIAYVNPGDFGKNKSLTTRYVCVVA